MSVEDKARAEAERQYPGWDSEVTGRHRVQRKEQEAFVAGAAWQREQTAHTRVEPGADVAARVEADRQWGEEPDLGDETPEAIWFTGFGAGHHAGAAWQAAQSVDTLQVRADAWVNAAALVGRLADDALAAGISASRVNDLRFVAEVIRTDAPKAYETKEGTHE